MLSNYLIGIKETHYQHMRLFLSVEEAPPHVQAYVCEQDTELLLEIPRIIKYPHEATDQILRHAMSTPAKKPGSVLVREGLPLQFLAIVHNLNADPTWKTEWILQALQGILRESEQRQLRFVTMPLLGAVHGSLQETEFFSLLKAAIDQILPRYLQQLWLILAENTDSVEFTELFIKLERVLITN